MGNDYHKDADQHLPQEFLDLYDVVRGLVGQSSTELIIQESDEHGAATDMTQVFMGSNYVAWTMPENYHGFPDKYMAAGVAFTIGHELGHITVHPGQGSDWMKEVRNLPVDAHEQFMWSNIISDIMVNYMVSKGSNFLSKTSQKAKDMVEKLDFGHRADSMFRVTSTGDLYGDPSKGNRAIDQAALLLQRGVNAFGVKMVDNRYTPPASTGLKQGDFYPHAAGDPQGISTIPPETPFFQTLMGYGRGPQIYPPIQHCVTHNHPDGQPYPKEWKTVVLLKQNVEVQKTSGGKYDVYQDKKGTSPRDKQSTSSYASFRQKNSAGNFINYEVVETMTFDGRSNPTTIEPVEFYKIKSGGSAQWIPARYCCPIDPDTGMPCSPNWNVHFGYKPPNYYKNRPGFQKYSFSTRLMLTQEWAVYYATRPEGYGGTTGRDAATKFMKDIGYTLHAAAMEAGGNF